MDIFAHFLWTYAVYFKTKYRFFAGIFGILPDMVSFGPFFVYNLLTNNLGMATIDSIPEYVFVGYRFTHSLIIFLVVFVVIYYIIREIPWILGGWLLHILIDIPTHTREFFPTPFLWPLSDFNFSGISWGNPTFMAVNYSLLIIIYLYLILFYKKRK